MTKKVSDTTQRLYDGICGILNENGQSLNKAQTYAIENLVQTVEESTEKRCCQITESILAKRDRLAELGSDNVVSEATIERVNEMVESRVQQLKKEIPEVLDYAKMKRMQECMEHIKECVGYNADEQVEKVAAESAKMLHSTKTLIETQAKQISEKSASLNETAKKVTELTEQVRQMKAKLEGREKQLVESLNKTKELLASNQSLQKKVEESKKINESIEQKRKNESLKFYLEQKISQYPKYEASLLRKHFQNAKSRAEIDENFSKALSMVAEKRDAMRTVAPPIQVAKVNNETVVVQQKKNNNLISGGETVVAESGNVGIPHDDIEQFIEDESFVDLDSDIISNDDMKRWISML